GSMSRRSWAENPEAPLLLPMRLWPKLSIEPLTSGPLLVAILPATMVSSKKVGWREMVRSPPPVLPATLLTIVLSRMSQLAPKLELMPPPSLAVLLPLSVQFSMLTKPAPTEMAPPEPEAKLLFKVDRIKWITAPGESTPPPLANAVL